jgi:enterobactin synthetase component F
VDAESLVRATGLPSRLLRGRSTFPLQDVVRHHLELMSKFRPGPLRGDMLLFTADEPIPGVRRDPSHTARSWDRYVAGEVRVHGVPCQHQHMLRPHHVPYIGSAVAAALTAHEALSAHGR